MYILPENPGDYYSVLIVVTGIALLIKYVQITTVYSLFSVLELNFATINGLEEPQGADPLPPSSTCSEDR